METRFLTYRNSTICYRLMGTGAEWLFCFHGYGEDSSSFGIFESLAAERYTVVALDLPFHGATDWREGLLFEPGDLVAIIHLIKPPQLPVSLLGYSMGGRVALQLAQILPGEITKMVLVAPDGLHKNRWQWLATQTKTGNRLFKRTMHNPGFMLSVVDLAGRWGLFNKSILKFIHYYLDDAVQREMLYRRWTSMRQFKPDAGLVKRNIITHSIQTTLVFGVFDKVILTKHGSRFRKHAADLITIKEIVTGHLLLKEKYAAVIYGFLHD